MKFSFCKTLGRFHFGIANDEVQFSIQLHRLQIDYFYKTKQLYPWIADFCTIYFKDVVNKIDYWEDIVEYSTFDKEIDIYSPKGSEKVISYWLQNSKKEFLAIEKKPDFVFRRQQQKGKKKNYIDCEVIY